MLNHHGRFSRVGPTSGRGRSRILSPWRGHAIVGLVPRIVLESEKGMRARGIVGEWLIDPNATFPFFDRGVVMLRCATFRDDFFLEI